MEAVRRRSVPAYDRRVAPCPLTDDERQTVTTVGAVCDRAFFPQIERFPASRNRRSQAAPTGNFEFHSDTAFRQFPALFEVQNERGGKRTARISSLKRR